MAVCRHEVAAYSQAALCANAKSRSAAQAAPSPMTITGRRPNRSERRPNRISVGTSTNAYVAKIDVRTRLEKRNLSA